MSFIRLHVTAEGQTEQAFVKLVLAPHLGKYNVVADARAVLTSKDKKVNKEYRGGLISYKKARADIITWMKQDGHTECRFTTMFDFYGLPDDFPGCTEAAKSADPYEKVNTIEAALLTDINDTRFIPYIQLHEFESLIFADPRQLDWEYLEHDRAIDTLFRMVEDGNPELINDSPQTAPSKRVINAIPEYDKVSAGVSVAGRIGIERIQARCPHFARWLRTLEGLGQHP